MMKAVAINAFDTYQERIWYFFRLTLSLKYKAKSTSESMLRRIGGAS
jgi:hypothetical protein